MTDPTRLTATALSRAMVEGRLTAETVMAANLERIEALNPRINAIVSLRPAADLLAEACAADRSPRRGWIAACRSP